MRDFLRKGSSGVPASGELKTLARRVLAIDVGGTHIKILATGQKERRLFPSGPKMTPKQMVAGVKKLAQDWAYDVVSIGYPGRVSKNKPKEEPRNLGRGWVGFDYKKAFGRPVRIINDAAMQALGSYKRGNMLFVGLGTGVGTALIIEGHVVPMEIAHLPYKKRTYEDYMGLRGLQRLGKKKWRREVEIAVSGLVNALELDDVVIGGGNVARLKMLPPNCRAGDNSKAFVGGYRMWDAERDTRGTHGGK